MYGNIPPQEVDAVRQDTREAFATGLRDGYLGLAVLLAPACGIAFARLKRLVYKDQAPVPTHPLAAHASEAGAGSGR